VRGRRVFEHAHRGREPLGRTYARNDKAAILKDLEQVYTTSRDWKDLEEGEWLPSPVAKEQMLVMVVPWCPSKVMLLDEPRSGSVHFRQRYFWSHLKRLIERRRLDSPGRAECKDCSFHIGLWLHHGERTGRLEMPVPKSRRMDIKEFYLGLSPGGKRKKLPRSENITVEEKGGYRKTRLKGWT